MKVQDYKITNGTVTIHISEFNRMNDYFKQLEEKEALLKEQEKKLDKVLEDNCICVARKNKRISYATIGKEICSFDNIGSYEILSKNEYTIKVMNAIKAALRMDLRFEFSRKHRQLREKYKAMSLFTFLKRKFK